MRACPLRYLPAGTATLVLALAVAGSSVHLPHLLATRLHLRAQSAQSAQSARITPQSPVRISGPAAAEVGGPLQAIGPPARLGIDAQARTVPPNVGEPCGVQAVTVAGREPLSSVGAGVVPAAWAAAPEARRSAAPGARPPPTAGARLRSTLCVYLQ